ncbi:SRPBCC family protein [Cerasicoccus fimbriatus]|uniref:SRPBCC family protein n=1 Tax=Cerasicoccus fimbriatus TaxID=3014554 RepID=UPI0022B4E279|nr:SRPBCC family protein [Cerasicoccus sp. TK19100]
MPKYSVERSILINAPRGKVYATVRDFHQWPQWSPWLICEPDAKLDFAKDGRSYAWIGQYIGEGNIAVTTENEGVAIDYRLTFIKPFKAVSKVRFEFGNAGEQTKVTWKMDSSLPIFLFFLTGMMKNMIGMDYERGLKMLRNYIEKGDRLSQLDIIGEESFTGFNYLGLRRQCAIAEVGPHMEEDFATIMQATEAAGIQPSGAPFSIYHKWDIGKARVDYTIGIPVTNGETPDGLLRGEIPSGKVYSIKLTGPYELLGNAWSAGITRQRSKVFKCGQHPPFETYQNDPRETDERELVTVVHFPLK